MERQCKKGPKFDIKTGRRMVQFISAFLYFVHCSAKYQSFTFFPYVIFFFDY